MYVGADGDGDRDKWYKYTHPDDQTGKGEGMFASVGNDMKFAMAKASYNFRNTVKQWMSEILQVAYEAAALCINTVRTFYLIVLAILGPLVLGLSVFDGFQFTLNTWLAKYVNVFLWLPVANIFGTIIGKVQENMLTVPAVAGYIINPGGGNSLMNKVTMLASTAVTSAGGATGGRMAQGAQNILNAPGHVMEGYRNAGKSEPNYQEQKLKS